MICQNYIARCYRVYQHKRNENASFLSIFNCRGRPKWRFSNLPRFWKNSSALGSFNCIFENNSLKALFGQNIKKLKILKLSPDSRYLQKLALKLDAMLKNKGWLKEPKFIWKSESHWSRMIKIAAFKDDHPKARKEGKIYAAPVQNDVLESLVSSNPSVEVEYCCRIAATLQVVSSNEGLVD